jgi:hypothetical protein
MDTGVNLAEAKPENVKAMFDHARGHGARRPRAAPPPRDRSRQDRQGEDMEKIAAAMADMLEDELLALTDKRLA